MFFKYLCASSFKKSPHNDDDDTCGGGGGNGNGGRCAIFDVEGCGLESETLSTTSTKQSALGDSTRTPGDWSRDLGEVVPNVLLLNLGHLLHLINSNCSHLSKILVKGEEVEDIIGGCRIQVGVQVCPFFSETGSGNFFSAMSFWVRAPQPGSSASTCTATRLNPPWSQQCHQCHTKVCGPLPLRSPQSLHPPVTQLLQ
ncbi:hypothetical protein Hamer_G004214 [Homarus americanus]|uniref:Uncharacterized protein n=1 Tax=Homarus americanus TaxID=6706 RepID=A0A8J5JJY2_HOMAM|nr:hypothetical protein Hamer_G004214 [Homarus americanus]